MRFAIWFDVLNLFFLVAFSPAMPYITFTSARLNG